MNILLFSTLVLCWTLLCWAVWPLSLGRYLVALGSSTMVVAILVLPT